MVSSCVMFVPGDLILQRYQTNAPLRLVLARTDNPEVVLVMCPVSGVCHVFAWSHDVVHHATLQTIEAAKEGVPTLWERLMANDV